MSNTYAGTPVFIPSTTTGATSTSNTYNIHGTYTPTVTTSGNLTYSYPSHYYQTEIYQELTLSDLFNVGDFVKVKGAYLHNEHALKDSIGLVHACYNEFCIVIFDFKFYKIQAEFLLNAFDE